MLDFVVMPNHIHGIIEIAYQQGRSNAAPLPSADAVPRVASGSLGAIVRSFKSAVTRRAGLELKISNRVWQRNYYETILRKEKELTNARVYILENPRKWEWDEENPGRRGR
jgi:REP element-mobilizing transposase RayT